MKNSFHIKNMNVVSPSSNELAGDYSGLKHTQMFFHIDHIHAVSLCVDDHVILEIVFVCETLSTLSADETFIVSSFQ